MMNQNPNCSNCSNGSYSFEVDTQKEILYCTEGGIDTEVQENGYCSEHRFIDE